MRLLAPGGPHARVPARGGTPMVDSDGHGQCLGQYLAPSEDLVTFGALCDILENFYCSTNLSKLQVSTCSRWRRERVRARVGDPMMDSDGHGQYLAPSEDLVKFGALCQFLEHF